METNELTKVAPPDVYGQRRAKLAARLTRPMLIAGGRGRPRQIPTLGYPFRAGSHYLYFGGPPVEGAAILIQPGSDGDEGCFLLRPESSYEDAVWVGQTPSDAALAAASGISVARLVAPDGLKSLPRGGEAGYVCPPCIPTLSWIEDNGLTPINEDERLAIIDLRLYKDEHELAAMRRAAEAAQAAHLAAMRATRPGASEAQIAAAFMGSLQARQCDVSFTPIITVRGEVLHLEGYPNVLEAGRLLLVDGGAQEPGGYTSDVTRTIPVSGVFSSIQRGLYETVLQAERAAIDACVVGKRYRDVHDLAAKVVCEGLVDAGLLKGDPEALLGRRAHTLFFPHGVGHLMGLDVHDLEDFGDLAGYAPGRSRRPAFGDKFLRLDRDLVPGMVVTIEPGIYLIPAVWGNPELVGPFEDVVNRPAIDALLRDSFGGIRIEDDVHVRDADAGGPEVLTQGLPTDPADLEALIGVDD
ncbi:MAG: aminopeptidase P N-terminal domain-containing protein [Phycisphaerae bacterium]